MRSDGDTINLMLIVRTAAELGEEILKKKGPVFFVPTMGFLHEGHASLLRMAAQDRDAEKSKGTVVMSLFVNPTQFNDARDLAAYPRDEARDSSIAKAAGCDLVFAPGVDEMYPDGFSATKINVGGVASRWEGECRPGHFEGVATVVAKLFHLVMPDFAYFGEKDWQQCAVISQMVSDLNFPVWLRFGDTVREADGVAMSSRNALIRPEIRPKAAALFSSLTACAESFRGGQDPRVAENEAKQRLLSEGFSKVDYVAIVDEDTLEPLDAPQPGARVLGAATLGGVRLIDNAPC